jgi:hypothetical protein
MTQTTVSTRLTRVAALWSLVFSIGMPVMAQEGKWASPSDPAGKHLIDVERKWAEADCVHSLVEQTILAEDFFGTSPEDGAIYSKADAVVEAKSNATQARECHLHDAKVRFFGASLAIVYGSESSIRKDKSGKDFKRSLAWTDTWLKRNGQWQIVTAQDMKMERK